MGFPLRKKSCCCNFPVLQPKNPALLSPHPLSPHSSERNVVAVRQKKPSFSSSPSIAKLIRGVGGSSFGGSRSKRRDGFRISCDLHLSPFLTYVRLARRGGDYVKTWLADQGDKNPSYILLLLLLPYRTALWKARANLKEGWRGERRTFQLPPPC